MAFINLSDQANELPGRRYQKTYSDGNAGDWVILDSAEPGESISIGLVIATGQGHIEFTADSVESVMAGTASGIDWDDGTVTASTMSYLPSGVTAVRPYRDSGTIRFVIAR